MNIVLITIAFFCGRFIGEVWKEIQEYENMKAKGYKLFKDDNGKYWWVD